MGRAVDERLARQLDDAERRGTFLVPACEKDLKALRQRVQKGLLAEPLDGAFARPAYVESLTPPQTHLHSMRALQERHPKWVFCGLSAAVAYGLPVTWGLLGEVHVITTPRSNARASRGVVHHRYACGEPLMLDGLRVTPLVRTAYDCLRSLPFCDAMAIADAALARLGWGPEKLESIIEKRYFHHAGVHRAAEVAGGSDPRSESGGESIARVVMEDLGFQEPELQVDVPNLVDPEHPFRVDFAWMTPGGLVLGELDGAEKSENPQMMHGMSTAEVLRRERMRESRLTLYGATVVRFSYDDVRNPPRLASLLDAAGVPRGRSRRPALPVPSRSAVMRLGNMTVLATTHVCEDPPRFSLRDPI